MRSADLHGILGCLVLATCLVLAGCSAQSWPTAAPGFPTTQATHMAGPSVVEAQTARYDGPRARIALGDFQVKAANATNVIGDGLREMLVTALFNTNRFIVLERQAIQDIMLEQDLSASGRVRRETAAPIGQLEAAELLVYGVVSEFQMGSGGGGLNLAMPNLPFGLGAGARNAHLGLEMRAVDTSTGRILFATRVEGKATDYDIGLRTRLGGGRTVMPIGLSAYKNTPMEKAIRVCIDNAVAALCSKTPADYYRHR